LQTGGQRRPAKIRVEILLPLFYNDGREVEKSKFLITREELAAKFTGCTALTPAEGLWINDKSKKYYDVNSRFYIVAPYTADSIKFLKEYKVGLKKRFA
jgi:hypothetical protein